MKIKRFEDLKCWQSARELVSKIYRVAETGKLNKDFDTKSQLKRTALSTMNNIAEGFGRFSSKDFIRFLDTSQSSAQEVSSMLYVLEDLEYLSIETIDEIRQKVEETKNLTSGLIRYLQGRSEIIFTSTPNTSAHQHNSKNESLRSH